MASASLTVIVLLAASPITALSKPFGTDPQAPGGRCVPVVAAVRPGEGLSDRRPGYVGAVAIGGQLELVGRERPRYMQRYGIADAIAERQHAVRVAAVDSLEVREIDGGALVDAGDGGGEAGGVVQPKQSARVGEGERLVGGDRDRGDIHHAAGTDLDRAVCRGDVRVHVERVAVADNDRAVVAERAAVPRPG